MAKLETDNQFVVEAALGRQDIAWDGGADMTIDVDCYWVFAIDVNDAIEEVNDLVAEWKIPDEDLDDADAREDDDEP